MIILKGAAPGSEKSAPQTERPAPAAAAAPAPEPPVGVMTPSGRVIVGMRPDAPEEDPTPEPSGFSRLLAPVSKLAEAMGVAPREDDYTPPPAVSPDPAATPSHALPRTGGRPGAMDRVLIQVTAAQVKRAVQVLGTKGIKNPGVQGDAIELECPSNRVSVILRALLEAHIELYGLARMAIDPGAAPADGTPPAS